MDGIDREAARRRIDDDRSETERLVAALARELDEIVESVSLSNNDDEHDPDGATNGYERAKATAMLHHAQERLTDLDGAAARLAEGSYGRCEHCGGDIGTERLEALVTTTLCRSCADVARPR